MVCIVKLLNGNECMKYSIAEKKRGFVLCGLTFGRVQFKISAGIHKSIKARQRALQKRHKCAQG